LASSQLFECRKKQKIVGDGTWYNLTQKSFTKLVFKDEIKKNLTSKIQAWLVLKENENVANDKQTHFHLKTSYEIKSKKKGQLPRLLPIVNPNIGIDFVQEVKKN
jgi:hypothetical protein